MSIVRQPASFLLPGNLDTSLGAGVSSGGELTVQSCLLHFHLMSFRRVALLASPRKFKSAWLRHLRISFSRVAWSILDCARRTSTFRACAFREQEDGQATLPILLRPRVARAKETNGLPFLSYTERGASTIGLLGDRTRNLVLHIESKIHDIGFFNNVVFAFKPE